jgi:hypothetical protein
VREEHESVALAGCVRFGCKKSLHELWRVRDEVLEFAVDGVYGEDGILADVRMAVFEARTAGRDERF